jgi:hypothetical protein
VLRTPGGLLEVSHINAPAETVQMTSPGKIGPFDFGSNVSKIRVDAVYRYHIPLASKWTIIRNRSQVYVVAPPAVPTVPVAIDTASLRQETSAGWLRFDKETTAKEAHALLTKTLGDRSKSVSYINQQREVARQTVKEFVAKWGVAPMNSVPPQNVHVVFSDESISNLVGPAFNAGGL